MSAEAKSERPKFTHVTSLDDVFSESSKKYSSEKKMYFESGSASFTLQNKQTPITTLLLLIKSDDIKVLDVQQLDTKDNYLVRFECYLENALSDIAATLTQHPDVKEFRLTVATPRNTSCSESFAWFPRKLTDLDHCGKNVLMYGTELDADHPGFKDAIYRKRRQFFTDIAMNYKHGDPIPTVDYLPKEVETWGKVYNKLTKLYPTHACKQYLQNLPLLSLYCNYSEHNVPQLEKVSKFLQEKTGFRMRPVAGFLSPRDFLAGLAFRVFNCTQYIRHSSDPFYTPEPDVCHELLGHVPLLADAEFAQFSQEMGLASLGASDDDIAKLAACYLYTVEFGLCKEDGCNKAYGAGLLSSISELEMFHLKTIIIISGHRLQEAAKQHALTNPEKVVQFDPLKASTQEFYVTTFQPVYFVSESFQEVQKDMRQFVKTIKRPFYVRFDALTHSVQVIDNLASLQSSVAKLSCDISMISDALKQILTMKTLNSEVVL